MKKDTIRMQALFNTTPSAVYNDWLYSKSHSKMTGGEAEIIPVIGSRFSAWNGYIKGQITALIPNKKISLQWRTTEFLDTDEDSILEIQLEAVKGGTQLKLVHTNIPTGQGPKYEVGWQEYYFKPMKHFYK